ncbi:uncharacterized protein LOC116924557 [Daphnia magna]|uniref:uncharacterized protein LOC116924557 n=1 Tax=Daphnia magna TaxID=35525 RepID=UPI001E1BBE8D|nr:uncharacterized protein LOC116924557 [Daphnia magna]
MDGTYGVTTVGFSLFHLLCEENKRESQPTTQYFTKTETREDISEFLCLFSENNDVSVTKVKITDKGCNEIAALEKYFPGTEHILCLFHVFKAVDSRLNQKVGDKALTQTCKEDIRERFRNAAYEETAADLKLKKRDGQGSLAAYFRDNWFTIESKWTKLGRRHLPTFGNGTKNLQKRSLY